MNTSFTFPQFRMLKNGMSYYRIDSPLQMTELKSIGKYWTESTLSARILPERILIQDLLTPDPDTYLIISRPDYEEFKADCIAKGTFRHL